MVKKGLTNQQNVLLYTQLVKCYYYYIDLGWTHGRAQRFVKRFLTNLVSENGIEITLLFHKYGALTVLDIMERTGINRQTANNIINALIPSELIQHVAYVKPPYTSKKGGRRPRIYAVEGFTLEQVTDAQRRYAEYSNEELRRERKKMKADEEERIRDETRRDAHVLQVIEDLGTPPEKMVPLYEAMKAAQVSPDDHDYVKNEVLSWIQNAKEEGGGARARSTKTRLSSPITLSERYVFRRAREPLLIRKS